jgi:hypothetical protein
MLMKKHLIVKTALVALIFATCFYTLKSDSWGLFGSIVNTDDVVNITNNSAIANVTVALAAGDADVTQTGVVWSTTTNPMTSLTPVAGVSGIVNYTGGTISGTTPVTYNSQITGLNTTTMYYLRSYVVCGGTTYYGNEISFTTIPTLPEWGIIALGGLVAMFGGWFVWRKIS